MISSRKTSRTSLRGALHRQTEEAETTEEVVASETRTDRIRMSEEISTTKASKVEET